MPVKHLSAYQSLCTALSIEPWQQKIALQDYHDVNVMSEKCLAERMTAAIQVLIELMEQEPSVRVSVSPLMLDYYIARLDAVISEQLDLILHHHQFQELESTWRGVYYLVENIDFRSNTKLELLNCSKEALQHDFEQQFDITQSGLYQHIYTDEYDTPGGEPYTAMISPYEFSAHSDDIDLLRNVGKVAASAHCPFISAVGTKFFLKSDYQQLNHIDDLSTYLDKVEFLDWQRFRKTENARYIGLTLPRMLIRRPYTSQDHGRGFLYQEKTTAPNASDYLWCSSVFAFAVNMAKSFKEYGWCVNIRGPESGGRVDKLILHQYDYGCGLQHKIPTESLISETRELEFANLGFIPLSYYKNSDYACFFSANSAQLPEQYQLPEANANSQLNVRLPYVLLSSRIAHYLKVLQRETIGANKDKAALRQELNSWLQTLITKMHNPGKELIAKHPLREAYVDVFSIADNPGYYQIKLHLVPHFQVEGMTINLALVSQLPGKIETDNSNT